MKKLSKILDEMMDKDPVLKRLKVIKMADVWKEAAGDLISSKANFVDFKGGTLIVECDDPLWRNEIDLIKGRIMKRMNEILGKDEVRKMIVRRGWKWRTTPRGT